MRVTALGASHGGMRVAAQFHQYRRTNRERNDLSTAEYLYSLLREGRGACQRYSGCRQGEQEPGRTRGVAGGPSRGSAGRSAWRRRELRVRGGPAKAVWSEDMVPSQLCAARGPGYAREGAHRLDEDEDLQAAGSEGQHDARGG